MSAMLAVPVPIKVMARAGPGARTVADRPGHALRYLRDHRAVQRGVTPGDQAHGDPDRVFQRLWADHGCHRSPASAGDSVTSRGWP